MNKDRIIELLEDQLKAATEQLKAFAEQLKASAEREAENQRVILRFTTQVEELTRTIHSLEDALVAKGIALGKQENRCKGLSRLISNESERQVPAAVSQKTSTAPTPKERGNNRAKRKPHYELEEEVVDIYPDDPLFDRAKAREIGVRDSIRYRFIPPRFIKQINRLHIYSAAGTVMSGQAPLAPFQNSQYDGSFIAGLCQLRYIYSMPVERIVGYFRENGFDLNKATAHGLLGKTANLFEKLYQAMRAAVLEDTYLCCDETFYKILVEEKNSKGKGIRKGYIWVAIAVNTGLVYYFYENGSRKQDVILDLLADYRHTMQSDAYAPYKKLETDQYPHITRLGCFQHVKRKFMDVGADPHAEEIVELINSLYHQEHKHRIGQDGWTHQEHYKFRQRYAPKIMEKIRKKLLRIKSDPELLPKSDLNQAVEYMLSEWNALNNIFTDGTYALDNNLAELYHRYIALSRKNSLFFGSHEGARRGAVFYSLACSCKMNKINFFEYLTDVINRAATLPENTKPETYRQMLPDKWRKNKEKTAE